MTKPDQRANNRDGAHIVPDEHHQPFEVFWADSTFGADSKLLDDCEAFEPAEPGWFWWFCHPGCLPDGEPSGPFPTSQAAHDDCLAFCGEGAAGDPG